MWRFERPDTDTKLRVPGLELQFNHRLKVAVGFVDDPRTPQEAFNDLEAHLNARGYVLQLIIAPPLRTLPPEGD